MVISIKNTKTLTIIISLLLLASSALLMGGMASAQSADAVERQARSCEENGGEWIGTEGRCDMSGAAKHNEEAVISDCQQETIDESNCGIVRYIVLVINVLAGLVGIVTVGSMIYAGIQYSMAGNDPQKVQAAKERIRNCLIALFFFVFSYALLNYLVPGGVL